MTPSETTTPSAATAPSPMEVLTEQRCWDTLRRLEFGRLAYAVDGHLDMAPINYAVHGGEIVFRTAEGSKLSAVLNGDEVVFEVDEVANEEAVSIIMRAIPREFPHDEARWADQMRLRPWVSTVKEHVVGLRPVQMSGRRFHLSRTWLSMRPHR